MTNKLDGHVHDEQRSLRPDILLIPLASLVPLVPFIPLILLVLLVVVISLMYGVSFAERTLLEINLQLQRNIATLSSQQ